MDDKLKPCPFCGGNNIIVSGEFAPEYWVHCDDCKASAQCRTTRSQAIEDWNTRPQNTEPCLPELTVTQIVELAELHGAEHLETGGMMMTHGMLANLADAITAIALNRTEEVRGEVGQAVPMPKAWFDENLRLMAVEAARKWNPSDPSARHNFNAGTKWMSQFVDIALSAARDTERAAHGEIEFYKNKAAAPSSLQQRQEPVARCRNPEFCMRIPDYCEECKEGGG